MNDAQLVLRASRGDRSAFEAIVERYKSLVCAVTYGATGDYADSEDLAQETFVAAWQQLGRLDKPEKLRPWLCSVARHVSFSAVRKRRREAECIRTLQDQQTPGKASDETPRDAATVREEQKLVWQIVGNIPEAYRVPLILYYREGHSVQRVAAATGLSESAVKQRLLRARRMLREEMASVLENSLANSKPGKKFTAAVVGALPPASMMNVPATQPVQAPSGGVVTRVREVLGAWSTPQVALSAVAALTVAGLALVGTNAVFGGSPRDNAENVAKAAAISAPRVQESVKLAALVEAPEEAAASGTQEPSSPPLSEKRDTPAANLAPGRVIAPAGYPGREANKGAVDTMKGTVYAPGGGPLPHAKVWVARNGMQARDTRETVADEKGRYELVVPPGQWVVAARLGRVGGESDVAPRGQVITNGEKKVIVADIPTEDGCIVRGRVYDQTTGRPIPHPRIWTVNQLLVEGDEKGFYEIEGQERDYQSLVVMCRGYARRYVIYSTMLCDEFELDLAVKPGACVKGLVVDKQGRGLAHAWVRLGRSGGSAGGWYEVCDEYGRFVYDGLSPGKEVTLIAEQPRYINTCWEPRPVEGKEERRETFTTPGLGESASEITFTLDPQDNKEVRQITRFPEHPPGGVVRGRLVTFDGEPVRNFRVITRTLPRGTGLPTGNGMEVNEASSGYSFTNDEGTFTLASRKLDPGTYLQLVATASGYKDAVVDAVLVHPLEDVVRVPETVFRLGMAKTLRVWITEADRGKKPIEGVNVSLEDVTEHWFKQPFEWRFAGSGTRRPISAVTDASGCAELEGINHEKGIVLITHPDYGRARTTWDGTERELELAMEPAAVIAGVVLDEHGAAPPNLSVRVDWCPGLPYDPQDFARSSRDYWDSSPGHDGRFRFGQLPPGYYMLTSTYYPNRQYDHTDAVQCSTEFYLEAGEVVRVHLPEDSIQANPQGWGAAGSQGKADDQLAARLLGAWENRWAIPNVGRQAQIVLVFYEDGRYGQTAFGEDNDRSWEESGTYRVRMGQLERLTDEGLTLSESVRFEGEELYLSLQPQPLFDGRDLYPFRRIDDISESLRRGRQLLAPGRTRAQPKQDDSEAPASGLAGYSQD